MRLTLLYGSLFLLSSAVLLAITYVLVDHNDLFLAQATSTGGHLARKRVLFRSSHPLQVLPPSFAKLPAAAQLEAAARKALETRSSDLHELLVGSIVALGLMAVLSVVLGWAVAGRVLQPLRAMAATAQQISADNLHQRLAIEGPDDELKHLAGTIDGLLGRLEAAFAAQRRFVANASHELRTPLAGMRTSLDVAMAKPGPVPSQFLTLDERLRRELDHADRMLESFLALAHTQHGPLGDESTVSLGELAHRAIDGHADAISALGLDVEQHHCSDAWVTGSQMLLTRLVDNVIDNAIGHNQPGGWARVTIAVVATWAHLVVENGGPVLDPDQVSGLTQPFRRIGAERTGSDKGAGMGLAIASSIVEVHSGTLDLEALPAGGLRVVVTLPLAVRPAAGAPA
jgi:hypothetical protein